MLKIEQETIINFNLEEKGAHIYTAIKPIKTRLLKMGFTPYRLRDGGAWFKVPKEFIMIRKPLPARNNPKAAIARLKKGATLP